MNLENNNPKLISPLTLAFVGDGVYDLLVRKYLVNHHDLHVGELNKIKVYHIQKITLKAIKYLLLFFQLFFSYPFSSFLVTIFRFF